MRRKEKYIILTGCVIAAALMVTIGIKASDQVKKDSTDKVDTIYEGNELIQTQNSEKQINETLEIILNAAKLSYTNVEVAYISDSSQEIEIIKVSLTEEMKPEELEALQEVCATALGCDEEKILFV